MRELHTRLNALGLVTTDSPDVFADGTVAVVEAFQRSRGLAITGEVDATCWSLLLEAGWRLGQRLLYLAGTHLRGDDVAQLQIHLAQLGFNPGHIDGIFGPLLHGALSDFQSNCGLEPDGVLNHATLVELLRLSSVATSRHLVNDARDQAGFNEADRGSLLLCGEGPLGPLVAAALGPSFDADLLATSSAEEVTTFANERHVALVLAFLQVEALNEIHVHYWASYQSYSQRGHRLANEIAAALARPTTLPRVEVTGMALPILRETTMATLQIEYGYPSDAVLSEAASEIALVINGFFHRSL